MVKEPLKITLDMRSERLLRRVAEALEAGNRIRYEQHMSKTPDGGGETIMVRRSVVLKLVEVDSSRNAAFYAPMIDGVADVDDINNICYTMPWNIFSEMGSPETVTLTVEPGDKLNG